MTVYCLNCGKERPEIYQICLKCGSARYSSVRDDNVSLTPCPECGGERSRAELRGSFHLAQPGSSGIDSSKVSEIAVLVCNSCGYIAFYATSPLNLLVKRPDKPATD